MSYYCVGMLVSHGNEVKFPTVTAVRWVEMGFGF